MVILGLVSSLLFLVPTVSAQDLLAERIRKITPRKRSIYFNKGIFHNGGIKQKSTLKAIRHSFSERVGYERIVFDYKTNKTPRIYGNMNSEENKIYLDFFNTELPKDINSFGSSKYIKNINFYPLSKDALSVELSLKKESTIDVFYLESPARLVIDIK